MATRQDSGRLPAPAVTNPSVGEFGLSDVLLQDLTCVQNCCGPVPFKSLRASDGSAEHLERGSGQAVLAALDVLRSGDVLRFRCACLLDSLTRHVGQQQKSTYEHLPEIFLAFRSECKHTSMIEHAS